MKSIIKYTFLGMLTLTAATACTGNFEDINTNPHEATEEMMEKDGLKTGSFLSQMIVRMIPFTAGGVQDDSYGSTGAYQHFQGLNADWYSGYIGATGTWKSSVHNGCYSFSQEWGNSMYKQCFTQIMPAWQNLAKNAVEMNQPQVKALGDVVKVLAMHRVTDYYGPIPYTSFKQGNVNAQFDSQETVYKRFFEELDSAIDILTPYAQSGAKIMSKYDYVYEGDALKWTKLANTLRLRLALRVVYADPTLAKQEAEKSAASAVGFLENASDDAKIVSTAISLMNPLYEQAYSWGEERMSATMDAYLNGLKDPRLSKYFKAAGDGGYHGVRQGANVNADKDSYRGDKISNLNLTAISPIYIMKASESYFLRAEAALRGWSMGGTAKSFYESGVKVAFTESGADGADAYLADDTDQPAAYTDNTGHNDSYAQPSTITVKWDDNAAFETNLERIITQKWIANWPISPEAWAEYRRTGYPKVLPVVRNMSGGTIDTNLGIRRMPYPTTLYDTNAEAVQGGVKLLGGADNGGTKLWWNKNPNH
jgi:hypothetical protein